MKIRSSKLTRREFIEKTSSVGAVASLGALLTPTAIQTTKTAVGKIGQSYPDQRRKYTDSKSNHTVWQLTNMEPGRVAKFSYYNVPKTTPDSRWALYSSDRASAKPGSLNLFKMDLRSGESIQMTDSADIETSDNVVMTPDGKEVYFFDNKKNLRIVDMETFKERKLTQLPENAEAPLHNTSVSPDKKFILTARPLEPKGVYSYLSDWALHHALIAIRTDNGQQHNLVEGMFPIGINEYCPTNPDLILWDIHGGWEQVHRPWIIHADGTGNRPVMMTVKGEGSGHQFWGWKGTTVFSMISGGGRYPQGLWACNLDGSNERCVIAGGTHAHAAANPEEDRFTEDEMYGRTDAIWVAKKGSFKPEILAQTIPWFELKAGQKAFSHGDSLREVDRVIGTTPFHPHARFLPNGTGLAYNNKSENGAGNMYIVEL